MLKVESGPTDPPPSPSVSVTFFLFKSSRIKAHLINALSFVLLA